MICKIDPVMQESTIELRSHNGPLYQLLVVGIDKIPLLIDSKANKCDAHPVLIEENIRVRATHEDCNLKSSHKLLILTSAPKVFFQKFDKH